MNPLAGGRDASIGAEVRLARRPPADDDFLARRNDVFDLDVEVRKPAVELTDECLDLVSAARRGQGRRAEDEAGIEKLAVEPRVVPLVEELIEDAVRSRDVLCNRLRFR